MADQYLYLQEYLTLIDWLNDRWGGKITRRFEDRYSGSSRKVNIGGTLSGISSDLDDDEEIRDVYSLKCYPVYQASIEGYQVGMALSDSDLLDLSFASPMKWAFKIRHEHWADKMFKKLRLDYEFQSGDAAFDKKYYIETKDPAHRKVFLEASLRDYVQRLEPFEKLVATTSRMAIARKIDSPDLLKPSAMKEMLDIMFQAARYLKR